MILTIFKRASQSKLMEAIIVYLFLTGMILVSAELYNAALYKPAIQSSNYKDCFAYKGVDGNADNFLSNGHCQHTGQELIPWWMVDLRGQFVVEKIQLTN
ncbi:fucolectin-7, partial [Biomphalaria pfeifferi]